MASNIAIDETESTGSPFSCEEIAAAFSESESEEEALDEADVVYDKELNRKFVQAITQHSVDSVKTLLEKVKRPNCFLRPNIVLLNAIDLNDEEIVRILLEARIPTGVGREADGSELHAAAIKGSIRMMQLLEHYLPKISFNQQGGRKYRSPLHLAVYWSNMECVNYLLQEKNVNPNNESFHDGTTPMHLAAMNGDLEMVRTLLNYAAALVVDNKNYAPWMYAFDKGHMKVVDLLLVAHGTDEVSQYCGTTAIHIACKVTKVDYVKFLVGKGANVNVLCYEGGNVVTPLILAIWCGHLNIAYYLLTECPNIDVTKTQGYGKPALHFTLESGLHLEETKPILNLMVQKGASLSKLIFLFMEDIPLCKWLFEAGANPNEPGPQNQSILMEAVFIIIKRSRTNSSYEDYFLYETTPLDTIIEANVNIGRMSAIESDYERVCSNCTPLVCALFFRRIVLAQYLLYLGFDTNAAYRWFSSQRNLPLWRTPELEQLYELLQEKQKANYEPRSLMELCRQPVLMQMGHSNVDRKISQLPLPSELKMFLFPPVSVVKSRFIPLNPPASLADYDSS